MVNYESGYHLDLHHFLYSDEDYYLARSRLSLKRYLVGFSDLKILEVGCGLGQNIFLCKNAVGYDISKFALDFCRKKGIDVVEDLNEIKKATVDVVLLCHVLEHFENPFEMLKKVHSKLKKNGQLVLILPFEKHRKTDFQLDKSQHLYCWNFKSINNLLIRLNFKVIENRYFFGKGYKRLLSVNRFSFGLYDFLVKLTGLVFRIKEMKIVAVKN